MPWSGLLALASGGASASEPAQGGIAPPTPGGRPVDERSIEAALSAAGLDPPGPVRVGLLALARLMAAGEVDGAGIDASGLPEPGALADLGGALWALGELGSRGDLLEVAAGRGGCWGAAGRLMRLGSQSRHLGRQAARSQEIMALLGEGEPLEARTAEGLLEAAWARAAGAGAGGLGGLRRWRMAELTRAFYRASMGIAPLEVTTGEVSALASACLEVALQVARREAAEAGGDAVDASGAAIPMAIVGLGKLGGWELNFSSDVDIVFIYGTDEGRVGAVGGERWGVHHFFSQVARRVTQVMEAGEVEGRLWRMDARLRPGGARGPLAHSVSAAVAYYEAWGRTFERAVWLKARTVAGDRALGEALIGQLAPFVYRRSLDPSAFEELGEIKGRIDRHASASRSTSLRLRVSSQRGALSAEVMELLGWDVKVGRGGIREIEFVVQALQLVYGGRQAALRSPTTARALEGLLAAGLLSALDADRLSTAYTLYRLCEHRVQMEGERQTHALPTAPDELEILGRRLGFEGASGLVERLGEHRARVRAIFERLLGGQGEEAPPEIARVLDWGELSMEDEGLLDAVVALGFERPRQAIGHLIVLRARPTSPFSPLADVALSRLGAALLGEVVSSADPDLALVGLVELVVGVGPRRSVFLALGRAPAAMRLLVGLFGASRYFTAILVRQPGAVEAVLSQGGWGSLAGAASGDQGWRSMEALRSELGAALAGIEGQEERLGRLIRFKHMAELRVALADLARVVDQPGVGQMLSDLAQVCVEAVRDEAWRELAARYGAPRGEGGRACRFCVVAMGKLGGRELSYGSDLDLIFVYDDGGVEGQAEGAGAESAEFFARLGRRMIAFLSTRLSQGRLYEVDTGLRPNGNRGALVVSRRAFEGYHASSSDLWERQALLRARALWEDGGLGDALSRCVREAAGRSGPGAREVLSALDAMRRRMEGEVARDRGRVYNIKSGSGGIVDVEFAVQAVQLLCASRAPEVLTPSTLEALEVIEAMDLLGEGRGARLREGYLFLRGLESRLRILEGVGECRVPVGDAGAMRRLARRAGYRGQAPGVELGRDLERVCAEVRAIYAHTVRDGVPFGEVGE